VTGVSGESEARIRELFEQALILAPCIIFLDEIDAVTPHRATAQREMERRIVAQLLSSLDGKILMFPLLFHFTFFFTIQTMSYIFSFCFLVRIES